MKKLFLSFISPCGRIGIGGFWWRQLVVAALLCPATVWLAHTLTWMKWGAWGDFIPIPFCLMQFSPMAFFPAWLAGAEAVNDVRLADGWAPDTLAGIHATPDLLLSLLLVCLLSWSCFALTLRRLRDIRSGLYLLPLFLPYVWLRLLDIWLYDHLGAILMVFFLISSLFCLPPRAASKVG